MSDLFSLPFIEGPGEAAFPGGGAWGVASAPTEIGIITKYSNRFLIQPNQIDDTTPCSYDSFVASEKIIDIEFFLRGLCPQPPTGGHRLPQTPAIKGILNSREIRSIAVRLSELAAKMCVSVSGRDGCL
jgi:hypothetical protein